MPDTNLLKRRILRRSLPLLLVLPATLAVAALLIAPVGETIAESLTGPGGAFSRYADFLGDGYNLRVIWRSIWIAGVTTILALVLGLIAASAIVRMQGTLRQVLVVLAVFPLLTGAIVRSFAWIVILGRNGIVNEALTGLGIVDEPIAMLFTPGAMIAGLVYLFVPLAILSLMGVLEAIDDSLSEAATSLGSSPMRVFRKVTLPLAVPGLIVGGVLVFTGSLAAFATARLLGGERYMILPTLLHEKVMVTFDWDAASVIAGIMVVMTLCIVLGANAVARRINPQAG